MSVFPNDVQLQVGEAEGIVVAPAAALGTGHAAEFGGPEHDGIVEETALLEVFDDRFLEFVKLEAEGGEFAFFHGGNFLLEF